MAIEIDTCHFCQEVKPVERTYLYPSKYKKLKTNFNNKLYNEGDYFIIIKTCKDCGIPSTSNKQ